MSLEPQALVLDIQRMSTEDGPGLRTTVFFKGCNLHCQWCHNPDSIALVPQVQFVSAKCIGCTTCSTICTNGALEQMVQGPVFNRALCKLCLACCEACPSGAIELRGKRFPLPALLKELLKDKAYYGQEGGVTLSGGEPLLQADAVTWLLKGLKKKGVHTALDTAGLVPQKTLLQALEYTDLLLYDLKLIDSGLHRNFTGAGNERILENLKLAAPYLKERGKKLWLRTPLIPGATDNPENIAGIARFLKEELWQYVERWELCAFNNLCEHKYEMLDLNWAFCGVPLMKKETLEELTALARKCLAPADLPVSWTGRSRLSDEQT